MVSSSGRASPCPQKALRGVIRWTRVDVLGAILWAFVAKSRQNLPNIDFWLRFEGPGVVHGGLSEVSARERKHASP